MASGGAPATFAPLRNRKGVAHDLGLLLDAVTFKRPARPDGIVVAATRVAIEDQVPLPAGLGLPDMGHFMDEMALQRERRGSENHHSNGVRRGGSGDAHAAPSSPCGAGNGHEPPPPDRYPRIVDCIAEHALGKRHFARRQLARAADRAGGRRAIVRLHAARAGQRGLSAFLTRGAHVRLEHLRCAA